MEKIRKTKSIQHQPSGLDTDYWQHFSSVFENAFPGKTLVQVLGQGGGGLNALGRQTVAALLNAANLEVNYTYTILEVISKFNAVYPGGDYEGLKDDFEAENTIFCPLSMGDDSKPFRTSPYQ